MSRTGNYTNPAFDLLMRMKKAKGVMFAPDMVRAVIQGYKTQTRRIVKRVPESPKAIYDFDENSCSAFMNEHFQVKFDWKTVFHGKTFTDPGFYTHTPPLGKVGDMIYIRETFRELVDCSTGELHSYSYYADMPEKFHKKHPHKWKPSIHMPRKAARIFLEITNVRIERLNDISKGDAIAEGIERMKNNPCEISISPFDTWYRNYGQEGFSPMKSTECFKMLWESLSGPGSWDLNPWVWVYDFKRVDGLLFEEVHGMLLEKK